MTLEEAKQILRDKLHSKIIFDEGVVEENGDGYAIHKDGKIIYFETLDDVKLEKKEKEKEK